MKINREQAREEINRHLEEYLIDRVGRINGNFKCLIKEHEHDDSSPGMSYDRNRNKAHCFKCNSDYDLFDLIGAEKGKEGADLFNYCYKLYGLEIDGRTTAEEDFSIHTQQVQREQREQKPPIEHKEYDFTKIIDEAHEDKRGEAYYRSRGLTQEIIDKYKLGYAETYNSLLKNYPELKSTSHKEKYYNYVLPYINNDGTCNYFLAEIRGRKLIDEWNGKYKKMISHPEINGKEYIHPARIFNERYLKANTPKIIYICEGIYDALSYEVVGAAAIAFIGTAHVRFLELCKRYKPNTHFIITLDNDGPGKEATQRVVKGLEELKIGYTIADTAGTAKDANEALQADKEAFTQAVQEAQEVINTQEEQEAEKGENPRPDAVSEYLSQAFVKDIEKFKTYKDKKTGFYNLDQIIGGLYAGLYVIGGISSVGKTTFVHQLGDQLADQGDHILYFSLEQSKFEMVSKSLARLTAKADYDNAVTGLSIRSGNINQAVIKAAEQYEETAKRVNIIEGNFKTNVDTIQEYVKNYIENNQVKPIVIIDYLQIIQGNDPRQSDKMKIDNIVTALKRMSRDNDLTVFVVSSLNRGNYLTPIDFESFKESGGIEYTADVVWGLQLNAINDSIFDSAQKIKEKREVIRNAKAAEPRKIELMCLKNRYGISSYSCNFNYYPKHDLYIPEFN
jgi:replicative DNA helicase